MKRTYTTVQIAQRLGIGRDSLYRWMRRRKIKPAPVTRIGRFRVRLWTDQDVARIKKYMKENYFEGRGKKRTEA